MNVCAQSICGNLLENVLSRCGGSLSQVPLVPVRVGMGAPAMILRPCVFGDLFSLWQPDRSVTRKHRALVMEISQVRIIYALHCMSLMSVD